MSHRIFIQLVALLNFIHQIWGHSVRDLFTLTENYIYFSRKAFGTESILSAKNEQLEYNIIVLTHTLLNEVFLH